MTEKLLNFLSTYCNEWFTAEQLAQNLKANLSSIETALWELIDENNYAIVVNFNKYPFEVMMVDVEL